MLKEEKQKKSKKSWKKARKQKNNWSVKGRRNRLSDFDEDNLPKVRKEKKQIDWQELLMEEEYDLNDG